MTTGSHEEPPTDPDHRQEEGVTPKPHLNQALRRARQKRHWSQKELAEQLGVSNETISRWENGVNTPQPEQLRKLSETFGETSEALGYPLEQESIKEEAPSSLSVEQTSLREGTLTPRRRRFGLIIAVISGLIVALIILGIVSRLVVPPTPRLQICGEAIFDGFHDKPGAKWNWRNPSGNATHRLTTTGLSLSTSANSYLDLNPNRNVNAPRFLRSITGNFTIETRLEFRPDANFQSAGFLLWQSPTTFIRIERGFGGPQRKSGVFMQEWDHSPAIINISGLEQHLTTAGSVELRVQRQGDHFTAWWREPGQTWQFEGETDLHFESLQVGVDLIADYNAPPITVSYDYFRVSCP